MVRAPDEHGTWAEVTRTLARDVVPVRLSQSGDRGYIGRFEVTGVLGRGGMGVVYDVVDTDGGHRCALKMISVRFLQLEDSQAADRFAHEIKVLERLNHPGVVRFMEYGLAETPEHEHLAYIVMERLSGRTIGEHVVDKERFDLARTVRIAGAVAEALAYLDGRNVQHRDLKPANIFLEKSGRVVLMDFGLARSDHFTQLTRAGHIVGTVFYMSPERLRGQPADIRSDVFALGVVMFEMLTGGRPHPEDDPTALVRAIKRGITWPGGFERTPGHRAVRELIDVMTIADAARRPTPWEIAERSRVIAESIAGRPLGLIETPAFGASQSAVSGAPPPQVVQPGPVGPTWTMSLLITISFSLLTFVSGLLIGTTRGRSTPIVPLNATSAPPPPTTVPPLATKQVVVSPRALPEFHSAEQAYRYGDARLREGAHAVAISALEAALEMNPAYSDAYRRLGDAYVSKGELAKAKSAYSRYRKLRPDAPDAEAIDRLLESF